MKRFCKVLKEIREQKGLSQTKLSKLAGLSAMMVRDYESSRSRPKTDNIINLANALQVDKTVLMNTDMRKYY